jgi:hypothetical protein
MEYLISPEAVAFAVYIFFFLVSAIGNTPARADA